MRRTLKGLILILMTTLATTIASAQSPITVAVLTNADGAHLGIYLNTLANIPAVTNVVLADPDGAIEPDARERLGDKLTAVYTDYAALLAAETPTMALISLEARLAPPVIAQALDAGCHVLAEKPACTDPADFAPLVAKANAANRHLMLALANRTNPEVQAAKQAIADGKLGDLYGLEMHLLQDQTRLTSDSYHASWFAHKDRAGGGHLTWLGIHWLDLAMYITGSPITALTGFAGNVGGQPLDIEDSAALALRFANGTFGTLTSGYYLDTGYAQHIKIWGSQGWLAIDNTPDRPTLTLYTTANGAPETTTTPRPDDFDVYHQFLTQAIAASANPDAAPPITSEESLRVLNILYQAYDAAEQGKVLGVE